MDKLWVGVLGGVAIAGVAWFFFGKKEEAVLGGELTEITVSGGFRPSAITLRKGKRTTLVFHRTDPSSCLEEVVLSEFKIRKYLPLTERVSIEIVPKRTGEFVFSCGMNMYHGKIIVQ